MHHNGFAHIFVIVIVAVIAIFGGWYYMQKSPGPVSSSIEGEKITDEFSDIQDWKTYRNMIFELKYPGNWQVVEPLSFATGVVFETKDGLYIDIKALHKDIISIESIEKLFKSKYEFEIDGQVGTMFIESDNSATLFVTRGLYKYMFVSGISDERLKKVLTTFRFIK